MNPLNDDSWKCSKLLLRPNFNQRDKTYSFRLIWIRASLAMKGYKPVKSNSLTKEICRSYATEEECLEGIMKNVLKNVLPRRKPAFKKMHKIWSFSVLWIG